MALRVTTWNVENFSSNSHNFSAKLAYLERTIRQIDPDVLALQEILTERALTDLADRLRMYSVIGQSDGRGNRVAFLLKQPPIDPTAITAWRLPPGFVVYKLNVDGRMSVVESLPRPALRVTVDHGGRHISFVGAHLRSKLLTLPNGSHTTADETLRASVAVLALHRRAAEAMTLREHSTELLASDHRVVILGDLNDAPQAATTQLMYGASGSQPTGPGDAADPNRAFQRADEYDRLRLFNVTMLAPQQERWSRIYKGEPELLDQILASEGLMPRRGNLRQAPKIEIRNDDIPSLDETPRYSSLKPDHAPVTAIFPGL